MQRKLYAYQCPKCGNLHYPYRMRCRQCQWSDYTASISRSEFEQVPLPTAGKLLTFTVLHNPTADFAVATLGLGIVELENGICVTGQLKIEKPKIGMQVKGKVERVRQGEYEKHYGMVFSPA